MATISAMVHTVSVSREGKVKLERVDVAHETGFGLVNPLSVKKQIEGQITWFYNDAMHQANTINDGHIVENNFNAFPLSRIDEDPPEINIRFFPTGHWLLGMGHDRATSVQVRDRRCDLPDHRQAIAICRTASTISAGAETHATRVGRPAASPPGTTARRGGSAIRSEFSEFGYSLRVRESRIARLPDVCWAPDYRAMLCRCGSWSSSSTGG